MEPPLISLDGEIITSPLPCFRCDKQLEGATFNDVVNQPYGGTVFQSHGQYGSTVFDPISTDKAIEITICDDCIKEAATKRKILFVYVVPSPPQIEYSIFDTTKDY